MKWLLRGLAVIFAAIVIALIAFRVPDTDPAQMRAKYAGNPSQFVAFDGIEYHVRDEGPENSGGDAPAIVLLHGSNADLHTWQPWAQNLRADHRVIRFDQIGHGLTGPAEDDDYRIDSFVEDIDGLTRKLGVDRFVLVGNSMGGAIALRYAMLHPERLTGLVLVDAAGAPVEREGGGNLAFKLARLPGVGAILSTVLPRSLVERSLRQSVSNQAVANRQAIDRYWELARYPGNRAATAKRFAAERSDFAAAQVAEVAVPTLVMWGEEDALIPFEAAGWYARHLPDATLASYPGIGHLPMEEAPERTLSDLRRWLAMQNLSGTPR